jgi:CRISPR-associated protein Csx14
MIAAKPTTMIGTLGGQPQVLTFALDALLADGVPVANCVVLHFAAANRRIKRSLDKLAAEFVNGRYRERPLSLQLYPIRANGQTVHDIYDEGDANTAWEAINQLIIDLKNARHTLHVCISGGRRVLGLLTMSAAMLHFGHQDVLWHMYTPDDLHRAADEGAIMHPPPDAGFRLIRVPMMPWGSYFPALRQLARPTAAERDVLAAPRAALDYAEEARKRAVLHRLTERQTEVLFAFAGGLNPQQVAERLFISIKTVDTHKTVILAECRNAWNLPEDAYLDYRFLADTFAAV